MSAKVCCHCGKPIEIPAGRRGEASQSHRFQLDEKRVRIVHEHLACGLKADQPLSREAYEAIFEAEKAGVA